MYEIYTKESCAYCNRTKELLSQKKLDFKEFMIGKNITLAEIKNKFPDAKRVPIVLLDGQIIGTYENLIDHLNPPLNEENLHGNGTDQTRHD